MSPSHTARCAAASYAAAAAAAPLAGMDCVTPITSARRTALQRFWLKVDITPTCWNWTGYRLPSGYGTMGRGTKAEGKMYAHRFSYEQFIGPIPDDCVVCHRCDNPRCVRPAHLFIGTQGDNLRDMVSKGRERPWNREIDACKRGHAFTPENTRLSNGKRVCRTYHREWAAVRRARLRQQGARAA